ncbi:cysteine hydrolase family protein [Sphingomonas sp. UYP23]
MNLGERPGLLIIDVQIGFEDQRWGPRNNPNAEASVAELIAAWRTAGRPIVHVRHDSQSALGCFQTLTRGNDPKPDAEAIDGEPIHHKTVNSAFIGTSLERDLRSAGIDEVVIVGLTTNHCVSTTARMAANLGFRTIVVADATATFDGLALDGSVRLAADVHATALSDLKGEFAEIEDTVDVVAALRRSASA